MKIDLHCHSMHSKRPSIWLMQKIGCPESFTQPTDLYRIAREHGMGGVTVTDHNVIDACLDIAHLPNTFISVESTVYFPEDGVKIHVLIYDITEDQFRVIQSLRENVYDLLDYMNRENILYSLAHALFQVSERFGLEHFEKCLLLFKYYEFNGDQNADANALLKTIIGSLDQRFIEELAERHGITPAFDEPWIKYWTGGSDDHSSLHLTRTHTEIAGARTPREFLAGVRNGNAIIHCDPASPQMMAHNVYGTAWQYYKNKFGLGRHVSKDVFLKFMDRVLQNTTPSEDTLFSRFQMYLGQKRTARSASEKQQTIFGVMRREAQDIILNNPEFNAMSRGAAPGPGGMEAKWAHFVNDVSNRVLTGFGNHVLDRVIGGNIFDVFTAVGSGGALYSMLAPYFVGFSMHSKERRFARRIHDGIQTQRTVEAANREPRIGKFTDTFFDMNGVAVTLQQQARVAEKLGKEYTIVTCDPQELNLGSCIKNFKPVGMYELPEYEGQKVFWPPFMEMLEYCYEKDLTHIHIATPGPIGLAALGIARILRLPTAGTYHTSFPQYARHITDDDFIEEMMWKYMIWFYDQLDVVYCPSKSTAQELIAKGLNPKKIRVYPRGVDTERFHPDKGLLPQAERFRRMDGLNLIYVGRISREKNLDTLSRVYKALLQSHPTLHLTLVGEGPYMDEMKSELAGTPAVFTGRLDGDDLCAAFASADLFVFPSTTDTFGNVVLEAQACGLPVIVTDMGGPRENVIAGETGLVVGAGDDRALLRGIASLISDPARLNQMGRTARATMEERSFENAFLKMWNLYRDSSTPHTTPTDSNLLQSFEAIAL